ncbi:hypothetical protein ACWGJ9_11820 [Curtobacterium citreum]
MTSRLLIIDGALSVVPDDNRYQAPDPENVAALPHETLLQLAVYIGRQDRQHAIAERFIWVDSYDQLVEERGCDCGCQDDEETDVDLLRRDPDGFLAKVQEEHESYLPRYIAAVRAYIDFDFHLDVRRNGYIMSRDADKVLAFLREAQGAGVVFA